MKRVIEIIDETYAFEYFITEPGQEVRVEYDRASFKAVAGKKSIPVRRIDPDVLTKTYYQKTT